MPYETRPEIDGLKDRSDGLLRQLEEVHAEPSGARKSRRRSER